MFDPAVEQNRTGDSGEAQSQARRTAGAVDERGTDGSTGKLAFDTPSPARIPLAEPRTCEAGIWQDLTSNQEPHAQGDRVSDDYRASHCAPGYGAHYNKTQESGYYGALWEKIERPLISSGLRPMGGAGRKCLDFACGTGRITNVAAGLFGEVVGVDVSKSMLACPQVPPNVRLCRIDMTMESLDETFDS
ncbi:class I SAM-dependent methyltransferase [Mesorhizobium sp. ORM6]